MVIVGAKSVFGLSDQVKLSNFYEVGLDIILYMERITKAPTRLCGYTGLSAPLLLTCNKVMFSDIEAHMIQVNVKSIHVLFIT